MKKIVFISLILIIISGLGFAFFYFSQPSGKTLTEKEKEEALEEILGRNVKLTNDTPTGESVYTGKTISFSYPAKAEIYEYRENSTTKKSNALDDFSFDMRNPRLIFNMKVIPNSSNITKITDIPGARLREERNGEYKKESFDIEGEEGVSYFKSLDDPEKSGFLIYYGKIYTFSVTGTSGEYVKELFDSIISSSKFK